MSVLSLVLFLLTHFTDILGIIKEIIDLIHQVPHSERSQVLESIYQSAQSGDRNALVSAVQEHKAKYCESGEVGCPSDVKEP